MGCYGCVKKWVRVENMHPSIRGVLESVTSVVVITCVDSDGTCLHVSTPDATVLVEREDDVVYLALKTPRVLTELCKCLKRKPLMGLADTLAELSAIVRLGASYEDALQVVARFR